MKVVREMVTTTTTISTGNIAKMLIINMRILLKKSLEIIALAPNPDTSALMLLLRTNVITKVR